MKQPLLRLLAAFGLVPARQYAALTRRADEHRAASLDWKKKSGELLARVKALEHEVNQQMQLVSELKAIESKLQHRDAELAATQTRLADTERHLGHAREHLMAIEVKLDILEGAANVLDARTRTAPRQPRETGASV